MTTRLWRLGLTAALAGVALVSTLFSSSVAAASAPTPALYVNYAMNCTFAILDDSGKQVTSIPPGRYEVVVSTPILFSSFVQGTGTSDFTGCQGHTQFQLTGPGVNLSTTLFNGCSSNQVFPPENFQPSSTYIAQDNNQPTVTRVVLTTLATGSPAQPASSYSGTSTGPGTAATDVVGSAVGKSTILGSLVASMSRAGAVTLTSKGAPVATIPPGRYRVTVVDKSTRMGVALQETGHRPVTVSGASFVGSRSKVIDFADGSWWVLALPGGRHKAFRVSAGRS